MGGDLRCPVQPSHSATLDVAHASWVNHEVYYFSTMAAKQRFDRQPTHWCGVITDPVSLERFHPTGDEPTAHHAGRLFYFLSLDSRDTFVASPEPYWRPRNRMTPAPEAEAEVGSENAGDVRVSTG